MARGRDVNGQSMARKCHYVGSQRHNDKYYGEILYSGHEAKRITILLVWIITVQSHITYAEA